MREVYVDAEGCRIKVRDDEYEGDAVLFLHYGGGNLMMWQRVLPFFKDRYRLVLLDLRGHGQSDAPLTGNRIEPMARDVALAMEGLGIGQAHVVGSSLGAEVALSLAANHPEKVLSLSCDGALSSEYGPYSTWQGSEAEFRAHAAAQVEEMSQRPEAAYPSVDALVEARKNVYEKNGIWNEYFEAMTRYGVRQMDDGSFIHAWRKHSRDEYMASYFDCRFEDYYRKIKCPVLMLPCEDELGDEGFVKAMNGLCALLPQGRIVRVPGWIHPYGWLLDLDKMAEAVLAFLDECMTHRSAR
jgi:pimeloyl-ACP methyl ester carboxylesterase